MKWVAGLKNSAQSPVAFLAHHSSLCLSVVLFPDFCLTVRTPSYFILFTAVIILWVYLVGGLLTYDLSVPFPPRIDALLGWEQQPTLEQGLAPTQRVHGGAAMSISLVEEHGDCWMLFLSQGNSTLPSLILLLAVVLFGADRRCLSHAVILAEELVFALFLISTLSLDLSCFPKTNQLVLMEVFHRRSTIHPTGNGEPPEFPHRHLSPSIR